MPNFLAGLLQQSVRRQSRLVADKNAPLSEQRAAIRKQIMNSWAGLE